MIRLSDCIYVLIFLVGVPFSIAFMVTFGYILLETGNKIGNCFCSWLYRKDKK